MNSDGPNVSERICYLMWYPAVVRVVWAPASVGSQSGYSHWSSGKSTVVLGAVRCEWRDITIARSSMSIEAALA